MSETVTARYLGGTPVLFPHLQGEGPHAGEMCVIDAAGDHVFRLRGSDVAPDEQLFAADAGNLVMGGDEIEIDEASAEGRDDLEPYGTTDTFTDASGGQWVDGELVGADEDDVPDEMNLDEGDVADAGEVI